MTSQQASEIHNATDESPPANSDTAAAADAAVSTARARQRNRVSESTSVPDIQVVDSGGASGSLRRVQSDADLATVSVLSPGLRAALESAASAGPAARSGFDRLAGAEANMSWMFPPHTFADKHQGVRKKVVRNPEPQDPNAPAMNRRVRKFYKRQDDLIDTYGKIYSDIVQAEVPGTAGASDAEGSPGGSSWCACCNNQGQEDEDDETTCSIRLAQLSFAINLILLAIKAAAFFLSGSLSVISSLIDSLIDLVSGVVVWVANRQVKKRNPYYYPQVRTRIEPIAIVILAVIMSTSTVQIIIQAIESIVNKATQTKTAAKNGSACECGGGANGSLFVFTSDTSATTDTSNWPFTFGLIGAVIVLKSILFVLCYKLGTTSSTEALAQDHRNDCISNTTVLIMTVMAAYVWPYLDAIGALVISIYIIYTWVQTLKAQIRLLTGYTADPDCLKQITYICVNHHPLIQQLDTVRAFHIGNNHLVEVDIVVPGDLPLREAHDIGESLQRKLEMLDWVERAFVHLDYEFTHHPNTEHKQV